MIDYIGISDEARRIRSYFRQPGQSMTPETVCKRKEIDIELIGMDTALSTDVYKANYSYIKRQHIVQYNTKLTLYRDAVLYHEIGHRMLHWRCSDFVFHIDSDVFGVSTLFEAEANVFSAEMLLEDEKVLHFLFEREYTFFQTARALGVPDELLYFKCRILKARGHDIRLPISASGDFMRGKLY